MKKTIISGIIVALVGWSAQGFAASNGASEFSPGDRMKDSTHRQSRGASSFAPGHEMKGAARTSHGASEFSPGDRMHDKQTR
jgi:hypothetical protein